MITTASVSKIKKSTYGHFEDEKYVDDTIRLNQLLDRSGTYYVFIYTENCNGCNRLESTVLKYINKGSRRLYLLNGDKYKTHLLEKDSKTNNYKSNYEVDDYTKLRICEYPCLLLIRNNEVTSHTIGYSEIKKLLNSTL